MRSETRLGDVCDEYQYGLVTGLIFNNDGGIVLDFKNERVKAIVGVSCPIGVGSKLASYEEYPGRGYQPQGNKQWIVDLLTVDVCEVKAWYSY